MTIIQALILGIIQGITEFLPVSSSGHLVIIPYLLGWDLPSDQMFPFDVLVQISTLMAVILVYREDILEIILSMIAGIRSKKPFDDIKAKTGWLTILATIPAILVGLLFKKQIETVFTLPVAAGAFLLVTALLITLSEKFGKKTRDITSLSWIDALVMGIAQAMAVFPGISRSGSAISGGMFKGLNRKTAGQFTFLMAIPIMTAAGVIGLIDLKLLPNTKEFLPMMIVGFITSGVVGFFAIRWLLGYITNHSLLPFAIYCFVLGCGTLLFSAGNPFYIKTSGMEPENSIYSITYSSSIEWIIPLINTCTDNLSPSIFTFERSESFQPETGIGAYLSYAEPQNSDLFAYEIGSDLLMPAAHENNPIDQLTLAAMESVYTGSISNYTMLKKMCPDCFSGQDQDSKQSLQIWGYPDDHPFKQLLHNTLETNHFSPGLLIAPTPELLKQALSLDNSAIGLLPQKVITEPLKTIPIADLAEGGFPLSIFVVSQSEPDSTLVKLLGCLQGAINP